MLRFQKILKFLILTGAVIIVIHIFLLYYYTPSRRSLFAIPSIETPIDLIESVFKENRAFDSCLLPFAYGTVGMDSECSLQSRSESLRIHSNGVSDPPSSPPRQFDDDYSPHFSQYNADMHVKKMTITGGPYLTPVFDGRLGNELFEYASAYALARRYNYTLVLKRNCTPATFHNLFEGGLISALDAHSKNVCSRAGIYMIGEKHPVDPRSVEEGFEDLALSLKYPPADRQGNTQKLTELPNVVLKGFMQSFRNFHHLRPLILREFTFEHRILAAAASVLDSLHQETLEKLGTGFDERGRNRVSPLCLHELNTRQSASGRRLAPAVSLKSFSSSNSSNNGSSRRASSVRGSSLPHRKRVRIVFIAVHVRNGDYEYVATKRGAVLPPNAYYLAAFEHLRDLYARRERELNEQLPEEGAGASARVQFLLRLVICSDDRHWVQRNFPDALRPFSVLIGGRNAHYERSDALYAELAREHSAQWLDLVILSLCEHSILSIGTFGWWAAYLRRPLILPLSDPPRFLDDDGIAIPRANLTSLKQQQTSFSKDVSAPEVNGGAAEQASFFLRSTAHPQARRRRRRTTAPHWPTSTLRPKRRPRARRSATTASVVTPSDAYERDQRDAERCPGETLYYSEICEPETHYYSLYCEHAAIYFPPEWRAFDLARVSATLDRYIANPNFL